MKLSGTPMTALKLRNILIAIVVLLFIGAGAGFYFAYGVIEKYANEVGTTVAQANQTNNLNSSLSTLQSDLAKQQEVAQLANTLFASSANWQTQVINDINVYAQASGITVTDFNLGTTPGAQLPGTVPGTTTGTSTSTPTQNFTITLGEPVSYTSLLKFMTYISNSLPKMQINGVALNRSGDGGDSVSISTLEIGVYVR